MTPPSPHELLARSRPSPDSIPAAHRIALAELAHVVTHNGAAKTESFIAWRQREPDSIPPPIWCHRTAPTAPLLLQDGNHRLATARVLGHGFIDAIISTGAAEFAVHKELYRWGLIGERQVAGSPPSAALLALHAQLRESRLA